MDIVYVGFFVSQSDIYSLFSPRLSKLIVAPHVTTKYRPKKDEIHPELFGERVTITITGYGIDGENEGVAVTICPTSPELMEAYSKIPRPHITLSISENGKAVNTAGLN
ncbi:MAG: hypothetical protein MJ154_03570, partial [Candidatus Saccharibacteria bacterium]|nr:hypothetical protein [Candidatus Saccharibacteria bacterium]